MARGLLVFAAPMFRRLSVLVVIALVGCVPSAEEAFAPHAEFGTQIDMCRDQNACVPLCVRVFDVGIQDVAACRITRMQHDGAWVRIDYYSEDDGYGFDWGDSDDGGGGGGGGYEETPDYPDYPDEDNEPDDDPEPDDDDGYDGDEEP